MRQIGRAAKGGKAKRLTTLPENVREFDAAWSRDGQKISFVSWTDRGLGKVHTISPSGGALVSVTRDPGHYRRPAFSPNGRHVVFEKSSGGYLTAPEWSGDTGIYIATNGAAPEKVRGSGSYAHFADDNERLYFSANNDKKLALMSTDLSGGKKRVHASSKLAQSYFMSPDGKTIAFRENYNLYVMPALKGPQNVAAGPKATPRQSTTTASPNASKAKPPTTGQPPGRASRATETHPAIHLAAARANTARPSR